MPLAFSASPAVLISILVLATACTPSASRRCEGRADRPSARQTDDRLTLGVTPEGSVSGVTVGTRDLPMLAKPGGFSVRVAGRTENLLENPSFERDRDGNAVPDGWRFAAGAGELELTGGESHSGERSIRISLPRQGVSRSFATSIAVDPLTNYVVSGWFRTQAIQPTIPTAVRETYHQHSPVELEVVQRSARGRAALGSAHSYTDSAGWHKQFVGFKTGSDVRRVDIRGVIRDGTGTAWFDDVFVGKLFQGGAVPVSGAVERSGERFEQHAQTAGGDLSLDATYRPARDHVRIDGTISTTQSKDAAVEVTYTVPVDATRWWWADDVRQSRRIEQRTYASLSNSSLQQTSVYPFGAVFDTRSTLAIGMPLAKPRMFRIGYTVGRGLSIAFDLGLSGTSRHRRADFSLVVFTSNPAWGFRAATEKYYDLFPESFVRRTDPSCEGAWFVAPPLGAIEESYRRFGLGLHMVALGKASSQSYDTWGTRYLDWDDRHGIYSSAYGHLWVFYQPISSSPAA
ncbi:MAG: hypothetical protein M3N24_09120, partial [Actinomycetota bacterium]|nr:hypothetical protein [Actinomycetota bacterium]